MARGLWRAHRDQFAPAIEDLNEVISLGPPNAAAHYWRALCRANLGEFDLARQDAEQADGLMPSVWSASDLLIRLATHQEQPDRAIEVAAQAIARHPEVPNLYYSRARAYSQKQSYAEAEADLTKSLQLAPEWADALYQRAWTRFQLKQTDKAIADLESWESLQPPAWSARRMRCLALIEFSHWAQAATLLADDSFTPSSAEKCERLSLLGFCLANQGKLEMAIEQQTLVLEIAPDFLRARALRAIAFVQVPSPVARLLSSNSCRTLAKRCSA